MAGCENFTFISSIYTILFSSNGVEMLPKFRQGFAAENAITGEGEVVQFAVWALKARKI